MYEEILFDRYKTYSNEELKEVKVSNGYTEEAERMAMQLLSERKAEPENDLGRQEEALASQEENSDLDMTTEQINKMLYDEYKTYSQEELEEITYANGYTKEAEQIAKQILGKDVIECADDFDVSGQELKEYEKDVVYCINCGAKCPEGAKFCMECGFKVVRKEQVEREHMRDADVDINPNYKKLGGWLAFFAYGQLVGGILIGIGAVLLVFINMKLAKQFSQYAVPIEDTVRWNLMLTIVFCGVLIAYSFTLFRMIRKRDCRFLHFYEMVTLIACGIIIVWMIYQKMIGAEIAPKDVSSLLSDIIMFVVWMTYFTKSVRVRTYFGSDEYLEKCLICKWKVNSIARRMIPKRLKNIFPNTAPVVTIGLYFAIVVVIVSIISVCAGRRHDLSGIYQTTEFFPFSQIEFDKSGTFFAVNYDDSYTETYEGKYRKQNNGEYICRFTGGNSSDGNPVMEFQAANMDGQCKVGVKKVDENTLEVWIIPQIGYWAWNGEIVYFYK